MSFPRIGRIRWFRSSASPLVTVLSVSPTRVADGPGARPVNRQPGWGSIGGTLQEAVNGQSPRTGRHPCLTATRERPSNAHDDAKRHQRTNEKTPAASQVAAPGHQSVRSTDLWRSRPPINSRRQHTGWLQAGLLASGSSSRRAFPSRLRIETVACCGGRHRLQRRVRGRLSRPSHLVPALPGHLQREEVYPPIPRAPNEKPISREEKPASRFPAGRTTPTKREEEGFHAGCVVSSTLSG